MTPPLRPRGFRAFALTLVLACSPAAASESFVHYLGEPPPVAATQGSPDNANPQIEKLLGQSSGLWERIRSGFAIPDLDNKAVASHIAWYAARPDHVQAIVLRARPYLHFIVDEVERRGLPTELALLPFIESGFNPMALSPARASGLWQFIPETGIKYKLAQNSLYDGRRDVVASTGAALDYLQFLLAFNRGDWQKALASYNWGEHAVARAVERNRSLGLPETYDSLSMPEETRNYVPRLLAIKSIIADPVAYGVKLPEIANEPVFAVVRFSHDIDLKLAAQFADMPLEDFLTLNPAFNSKHAPGATGAALAIPFARSETFKVNLDRHQASLPRQDGTRVAAPRPARAVSGTRF
jgi:membrane-bound lytic murein transglycosylase D